MRQRRRRFLRALCDVQARSGDGLSFREGDLVILVAKPQVKIWMGYVHGAQSKLGTFPANAVKTMRSVCLAEDILPGTFITVALPKQSGTIEVLLPLGAKAGADVVFSLPSEASSLTKPESNGAVRVAGEVVLPEDQEKQLELHLRQVARDNEMDLSDTPQELWSPAAEVPLSRVTTSVPSSGLLTVKILELRRMKNGVLKKDDLPLRLLVGHTEQRVDVDNEASFMIPEDASSATMLVVLEEGPGPAQASIGLGSAVRSHLSRSWHTLYCDSTEQKNQCLLHLELRFDSEAKITDPVNAVDDSVHLQHGNEISLDQTERDTDLLDQDATIAALEDFCDNKDAASVLCLTGPQGKPSSCTFSSGALTRGMPIVRRWWQAALGRGIHEPMERETERRGGSAVTCAVYLSCRHGKRLRHKSAEILVAAMHRNDPDAAIVASMRPNWRCKEACPNVGWFVASIGCNLWQSCVCSVRYGSHAQSTWVLVSY